MLKPWAKLDARGWLIGAGGFSLAAAVGKKDHLAALAAVGVIIIGSASYADRRNRPLRWALVGLGLIVIAAAIYLMPE
jgi:hypothetical protein